MAMGVVVTALAVGAVWVARLGDAAPGVDRAKVWTATVMRGEMVRSVQGPGVLVPERIRWLSATTGARVERLAVSVGDSVTADAVVAELSNPEVELAALQAMLDVAAARAAMAELAGELALHGLEREGVLAALSSQVERSEYRARVDTDLAEVGAVPLGELAASQAAFAEASHARDVARRSLRIHQSRTVELLAAQGERVDRLEAIARLRGSAVDSLVVRAGVDGVVQDLALQVGQWVAPGTLLAKVAEPQALKAQLKIAAVQIADVAVGQPVQLDLRNAVVAGRVSRLEPSVQQGAVLVHVALTDVLPDSARPDQALVGTIELQRLTDVLHVDRPAQVVPESTVGLFRLSPDGVHAELISVALGHASMRTIELRRGVEEGDQLIVSDMSTWESKPRIRLK
jgi:multidrug resistance efflux pump